MKLLKRLSEKLQEEVPDYNADMDLSLQERPLSYSALKHFINGPRYLWEYYHGPKQPDTDALMMGNLFEIALLSPDELDEKYYLMPKVDKRTKDGKAEYERHLLEAGEKTLIDENELNQAIEMVKAAKQNPEIGAWLDQQVSYQEKIYYKDKVTGLSLRGIMDLRTDWNLNPCSITDVKTGAFQAVPADWERTVVKWAYWLQVAVYVYIIRNTRFVYPDYFWLVFEKQRPYGSNIIKADSTMLEESIRILENLLTAVNYCNENKLWHLDNSFWRLTAPYDTARLPGYFKPRI